MGDEPKGEPKYDTTKLRTLQQDLGRLNESFLPGPARGRRAAKKSAPATETASGATADPSEKAKLKSGTAKTKWKSAKSTVAEAKAAAKDAKAVRATATSKSVKSKSAKSKSAKSKRSSAAAEPATAAQRPDVAPADKGKAGARRLLAMLRRTEGDDSPFVPGTDFTEGGVVRLLAHLRRRKSQGFRFLRRLLRVLTRPAALGMRTSAGVSVERLQLVGRQLEEIEIHGWDHFRSRRVARRGRQALPFAPAVAVPDAPAEEV